MVASSYFSELQALLWDKLTVYDEIIIKNPKGIWNYRTWNCKTWKV